MDYALKVLKNGGSPQAYLLRSENRKKGESPGLMKESAADFTVSESHKFETKLIQIPVSCEITRKDDAKTTNGIIVDFGDGTSQRTQICGFNSSIYLRYDQVSRSYKLPDVSVYPQCIVFVKGNPKITLRYTDHTPVLASEINEWECLFSMRQM